MGKIFRTIAPYWKTVIVILILLTIQASCNLALPQYTSDIIDTGILNSGIHHILPQKMTDDKFDNVIKFMSELEADDFAKYYEKEGDHYNLTETDEKKLYELDRKFIVPIILSTYKTSDGEPFLIPRKLLQEQCDAVGYDVIEPSGYAFARECMEECGVDIGKIQTDYLWITGLKMLLIAILLTSASIGVGFFASRVGAGIGRDLRSDIFRKVVSFSNNEIDHFSTASLITRSTNDIQQIQMVVTVALRMALFAPVMSIGSIIKVMTTGAQMAWITVLAVIVIAVAVGVLIAISMPKFKLMQKLVDNVNLVAREILTGIPVIRAFKREDHEEKRFDKANTELTKTTLFTNRVMTFMSPVMMFVMYGTSVLIVWVSAGHIDEGTMQVGEMTAFITYAMHIVMSFLVLTMMSIMIPRAAVAAGRIDEVVKTESSITNPYKAIDLKNPDGVVKFDDVSFKYPGADENVLCNINFTANPGETTAIIGSTGSGKSTLINLIPRLYDVSDGKITIDGYDIRDLSMKSLRDIIGYVPQKGVLFSGTIESNIKYGNKNATTDEMENAAQVAQASEFIEEKPGKYRSEIAQGGTNVSGGQKQRLSIARAIAKNPKIYIFDDSFSALDMKTDAILREALNDYVKDSTVIIVAQRISTIINADKIIVLDEGKIAGMGKHRELLESCESYLEIAKSQLSPKELGIEEVTENE